MTVATRILVLSDNVGGDYVSRIEAGASRHGRVASYRVTGTNLYGTSGGAANLLQDEGLAGVILTAPLCDDRRTLGEVEARKLPYARISPLLDAGRGDTVAMDEYAAARAITEHLLAKGHRRIAFLRGPKEHLVSIRRFNGYSSALGSKGVALDQSLVVEGDFSRDSGKAAASRLFAMRPDAIFASNDDMAAGIIDAAGGAGVSIPGDISLVGFDDNAVAQSVRPALTTVRQPLGEMGEAACKLLIDRIRNPAKAVEHVEVPYSIVERASVQAR